MLLVFGGLSSVVGRWESSIDQTELHKKVCAKPEKDSGTMLSRTDPTPRSVGSNLVRLSKASHHF